MESFTYGSVGGPAGNCRLYLEVDARAVVEMRFISALIRMFLVFESEMLRTLAPLRNGVMLRTNRLSY